MGNFLLPLAFIGRPLERLFRLPPFPTLQRTIPFMQGLLAPPVRIEAVGAVAAAAAVGVIPSGFISVDDMVRLSEDLSVTDELF